MNIILDTCSIVNIINGDFIDHLMIHPTHNFYVGESLFEYELLNPTQKIVIGLLVSSRQIKLLPEDISISDFQKYYLKYDLGLGETESIILCKKLGYAICTDDLKARKSSTVELGKKNVVGTLFLIKECVKSKVITCDQALSIYKRILICGGYVPKGLTADYFCMD